MKKTIALLLLLSMLLTGFAGCSENSADTDETTNGTQNTAAEEQNGSIVEEAAPETELTHGLPEKSFDGETYTALIRTSKLTHFTADEMTGESLNDAVYERNNTVSEEFSVNLSFVDVEDNSGTFNNTVSQSIMARDAAYDLIAPDYWWSTEVNGWFLNLTTMDNIDLTKPWWCGGWNDAATINGMLPGAVGFYTLDMIQNMNMIFFNKNLYDSLGFDSQFELNGLYDTVRAGNWTFDLFNSMAEAAALDLNGDGIMGVGDQYGTLSDLQSGRALLWSCGMELSGRDADGNLVPTLTTEKNYNIFKSVLDFYNQASNLYNGNNNEIFSSDRALFLMSAIGNAVYLRDMESDFGVLPYPKYNPEDESYRSRNFGSSYFAIPITAKNIEMSAIILEAQNFYSYRDVRPTYYETILKSKVSRDTETSEMLDLVIDTCYIDPFFIYGTNLSYVADAPFGVVLGKTDTYMSKMKQLEKPVNKLLEKLAESIKPAELP